MITGLVINLKNAAERRHFALENVSKLQVKAVVLNAVEASSVEENVNLNLTRAAQACFESHHRSWQYILENDLELALICEDDFFQIKKFDIEAILASFDELDWDVIQIGFLKIGLNLKIEIILKNSQAKLFKGVGKTLQLLRVRNGLIIRKRIRESLASPRGFVYGDFQSGCHAYLVSRKGAEKLSSLPINIMPVDAMIHILAECNSINSFRSAKSFVAQFGFPSQISNRNH